jgi:hypothetical protein
MLRPCCGPSVNLHGPSSPSVESVRIRPDPSKIPSKPMHRVGAHASVRAYMRAQGIWYGRKPKCYGKKKKTQNPKKNTKPCGTESRCSVRGRFFQDLEVRRLPCQRQPIQSAAGSVSVTRSGRGLGAEMDAPAFRMPCEAPDKLKSALEICG